MKSIFPVLFIIFFLSCNQVKHNNDIQIVSPGRTTDASVLFFKNVRQPFYHRKEYPDEHLIIFQENTFKRKSTIQLIPSIYMNWRSDMAWLELHPSGFAADNPIKILWIDNDNTDQGILLLDTLSTDHYPIANEMSGHVKDNHRIFLIIGADTIPILTEKETERAFKITINDFLRLIESN